MTATPHRTEMQGDGGISPAERAGYIRDLLREMEGLAADIRLERLRDLLRLARTEADRAVRDYC